jgi:hypothetical protein
MKTHSIRRALAAGAVLAATVGATPTHAATGGTLAIFEGRTIDLSQGWGRAHACQIAPEGATCYRSESEMNLHNASFPATVTTATASCASSLRLYDGPSYTGTVVQLTTRGALISLPTLGFDNKTSSYKVGACAATMYSGTGMGLYSGNTGAFAQSPSMASGWDNAVSSVSIP